MQIWGKTKLTQDLTKDIQQSAKSSITYMMGQISATIIDAISIIIVARFLGSTTYGQYSIATIPITFALIFTDFGIRNGLIKYIAQFRSENRTGDISNLIKMALFINSSIGILLTLTLYIFSSFLAVNVFNQPEITVLIQIASINLIVQSLIKTVNGVIIGFERMEYLSILTIIQSLLKSFLSPFLVYLGFGALGAIVGHSASLMLAAIVGLIVVSVLVQKVSQPEISKNFEDIGSLLLSYGFPIFVSGILGGLLSQILNFMMGLYIAPSNIGNYKAALNFNVLISFLIVPISTALFPLFSKINEQETERLKMVYQNAVKYTSLITIPLVSLLILLSEPIVKIIYGISYPLTAQYLQLHSIDFLSLLFGAQVTGSMLNGQGKTDVIMKSSVVSLCIGSILGWYLIPRLGISGLILAMILNKGALANNLYWIKKNLNITPPLRTSLKIFISALASYIAIYTLFLIVPMKGWGSIIVGGGFFILIYLTMILLTRTLTLEDVQNLKNILGAMGPLTPMFNVFLGFFEKFLINNR